MRLLIAVTISACALAVLAHPCSAQPSTHPGTNIRAFGAKLYVMEVERFIAVEGRAPACEEDMLEHGYLFFLPPEGAVNWAIDGDYLVLTTGWDTGDDEEIPFPSKEYRLAIPSTAAYSKHEAQIKQIALDAAPTFKQTERVTPEDVESGRVSMDEWLTLKAYAADDAEWRQLCWARSLATTLAKSIVSYRTWHGQSPNLDELLVFCGQPNMNAWVAPKTGYPVCLQPYQSTMDPYYLGGDSWQITIPLFGAGSEQHAASFFWPGEHFFPGEHMRVGCGIGIGHPGALLVY